MSFRRRRDEPHPDEGDSPGPPEGAGGPEAGRPPAQGSGRYGEPVYAPQPYQPYVRDGFEAPRQPDPQWPSPRRPERAQPSPPPSVPAPRPPARQQPVLAGYWDRVPVGRPASVFEPKPPPSDPYRPDTVYDGWSTPHLTVRLASVRGDAHRFDGRPRQDDLVVAVHEPTGTVVFAVADGVSGAPDSHIGAALACRTAVRDLLTQLDADRAEPDWERVLSAAAWQLFMRVTGGAEPTAEQRAETQRKLATTLVAGTVTARPRGELEVHLVQIGDTAAWEFRGGDYRPLLAGKGGDDGDSVVTSAVLALPRVPAGLRVWRHVLPPDATLLVGTDGFGDPLGDGSGQVGVLMADALMRPPREPRMLAHLLDFSRETFDDDRTLLAVWPRHRLEEQRP